MLSHIVILGGGFTGSLSALACAPFAHRVTLVERCPADDLGGDAGRPQADHVHIFSEQGQRKLNDLVPGILDELRAMGATTADWSRDTLWESRFGTYPRHESGILTLLFSRKLLDKVLWKRVLALPNVRIVRDSVADIVMTAERVEAVQLRSGERIAEADLVLDARGRTSRIKETLENVLGPIRQKRIENSVRYTTTLVERLADDQNGIRQYYRQANATNIPLGYYVSPIEEGRTIFTVVDYHGTMKAPFDAVGTHPALAGRVVTKTKAFGNLHNVFTLFGEGPRWPKNLVVLGDALCQLNPVYGFGMTMGTEQVALIAKSLAAKGPPRARCMQKQLHGTVRSRWVAVALDESRSPHKSTPFLHACAHAYLDALGRASLRNLRLWRRSLEVLHGLRSPASLLAPWVCISILLAWFQQGLKRISGAPRQPWAGAAPRVLGVKPS